MRAPSRNRGPGAPPKHNETCVIAVRALELRPKLLLQHVCGALGFRVGSIRKRLDRIFTRTWKFMKAKGVPEGEVAARALQFGINDLDKKAHNLLRLVDAYILTAPQTVNPAPSSPVPSPAPSTMAENTVGLSLGLLDLNGTDVDSAAAFTSMDPGSGSEGPASSLSQQRDDTGLGIIDFEKLYISEDEEVEMVFT